MNSLVPLAAGGLAFTMIGAIATHVIRADPAPSIVITSLLFVMSVTVAVKRFGELAQVPRASGSAMEAG